MTTRFFVNESIEFFTIACQVRRLSRRLSPYTISGFSNTLRNLVAFTGDKPIDQVTRLDIRSFLASQTVGNKTLLNYYTGLSAFCKSLMAEGLVTANPMDGLTRPRPEIRTIQPIPVEHIRLMISAMSRSAPYQNNSRTVTNDLQRNSTRNRAMILFLLDTGVRVGELITIIKDEVDFNLCNVKVMGKGNKERIVYFSPATALALWKYSQSNKSRFLFATESGLQMDRNKLAHILVRMCQRAGLFAA